MSKKNKNKVNPSGILLYAKKTGLTSFSSLWSIKHALGTSKVGHTGTLDSFADGLLVVLSGNMTHLVPHVTRFTKTYQALVCFGKETDTLDPTGTIVKTGNKVSREQLEKACQNFTGALLQTPPAFSALHVDGKRASDLVRSGKEVELEPRQIFIYSNRILEFEEGTGGCSYALLEIKCSKGTYIRALARDMALSMSSCAYLSALRRTKVGPFDLKDSALYEELEPLTIESGLKKEALIKSVNIVKKEDSEQSLDNIRGHFMTFTPDLANKCGFVVDELAKENESSYLTGRPLNGRMFKLLTSPETNSNSEYVFSDEIAVFYSDSAFAGMIKKEDGKLSYGFVVPHSVTKDFKVFTWQQIENGAFPVQWKEKGTALTVGSFDGMHAGHNALLTSIMEQRNFVKGIVTFKSSYKSCLSDFEGEVATLEQKLDFCAEKGLDFAIVIDFSTDFGRIDGYSFVRMLKSFCGMKYIAEGNDFSCGYEGALTVEKLKNYGNENDFFVEVVDDVMLNGRRISSSRIRKAVVSGDFVEVQKMLLRPFVYDCTPLEWTETKKNIFSSLKSGTQVLPENGNYNVVVNFKDDNTLKTMCFIDDKINLVLQDGEHIEDVKSIVFMAE